MLPWLDGKRIESWSEQHSASAELPRLVRMLVWATVPAGRVRTTRLPAGADVRLPGFDGILEVDPGVGNPWVPEGKSLWEISVQRSYRVKARADLKKRSGELPNEKRATTSFVVVSGRCWSEKKRQEVEQYAKERGWKDCRVIDAIALAEWIEKVPAVLAWASRTLAGQSLGLEIVERAWDAWSRQTSPPLSPDVVLAGRVGNVEEFGRFLARGSGPVVVTADSAAEAYGFALATLMAIPGEQKREEWFARTVIMRDPQAAVWIEQTSSPCVAILDPGVVHNQALDLARDHIVVRPAGSETSLKPGKDENVIRLRRPWPHEFREALTACLRKHDARTSEAEARTRTESCGGNLTVYIRRFAATGSYPPAWVERVRNNPANRAFLVALLAGRWDASREGDRQVLQKLAGGISWSELECRLRAYLDGEGDAPPIQNIESTWFLTAPLDAFILCGHLFTDEELGQFFGLCCEVFATFDPRLGLPDDERSFTAFLYPDRLPLHSEVLRDGMARTLLLIAVHGPHISGFAMCDPARRVKAFARDLTGLAQDKRFWASLDQQLPYLVEAAPEPFIEALEHLLEGRPEVIGNLLTESGHGHQATGLLWALEALAWDPAWFPRVADLFARMAEQDPGGQWANRPLNSLVATLRACFPQTHAPLGERLRVFEAIVKRHSTIAWPLVRGLLPSERDMAFGTRHPLFRMTVSTPQPTEREATTAWKHYFQQGIDLAGADAERWSELLWAVERRDDLGRQLRSQALGKLRAISETLTDERKRATFYEMLRRFVARHQAFPDTHWALDAGTLKAFAALRDRFEPKDPLLKYEELFTKMWPEFVRYGQQDPSVDLARLRVDALREVMQSRVRDGLVALLEKAESYANVLIPLSELVPDHEAFVNFVDLDSSQIHRARYLRDLACIGEKKFGQRWRHLMLRCIEAGDCPVEDRAALLSGLELRRDSLELAAQLGREGASFWVQADLFASKAGPEDIEPFLAQFIRCGRDLLSAVLYLHRHRREISSEALLAAIDALAERSEVRLNPGSHWIPEVFDELESRSDIDEGELLRREWAWLPFLTDAAKVVAKEGRQPLICRKVAEDPKTFVDLICLVFRTEGEPPRELDEQEQRRIERAWEVLNACQTVPGVKDGGAIDEPQLREWAKKARELAQSQCRRKVADEQIGELLAWAPEDPGDGVWPHRAIRRLIEDLKSEDIERGIAAGRFNMIGVRWGGAGDAESSEARRYREWLSKLSPVEWPRTTALLRKIADGLERTAETWQRRDEASRRLS